MGYKYSGCSRLNAVNISDIAAWCNIKFDDSGAHPFSYNSGVSNVCNLYLNGEQVTHLIIPDGVESINDYAFVGCNSLATVSVPNSVRSIGTSAFYGCSGLTAIHIPASMTSIGSNAFYGFMGDIYCYGSTPAEIVDDTFPYRYCALHVPYGAIGTYKSADYWKDFANIVEFAPTGVEAVSADGKPATEQQIYNLGGVRMAAPQRGLNIINGKKVVY